MCVWGGGGGHRVNYGKMSDMFASTPFLLPSPPSPLPPLPFPPLPLSSSLQTRDFQPMTPHNSVTLPITLVLHLSRDLPISAHTMFKIYKVVYSSDHAFQWPAGRHTDELVIREWAKGGAYSSSSAPSCDPDAAAAANTCHTVVSRQLCSACLEWLYFTEEGWALVQN